MKNVKNASETTEKNWKEVPLVIREGIEISKGYSRKSSS